MVSRTGTKEKEVSGGGNNCTRDLSMTRCTIWARFRVRTEGLVQWISTILPSAIMVEFQSVQIRNKSGKHTSRISTLLDKCV